jgi:purine-binding chemotaxis protein CheW
MTRTSDGGDRRILLTFRLLGEVLALDVARVHEIIDPLPDTPVPRADPFAPGLINVRGTVVPVLDLRRRLGLPAAERTEESRMIVLDMPLREETVKIAVEADGVDQVAEIAAAEIEPVPEIGIDWPPDFLEGVARRDGALVMLLRAETVFAPSRPAR